MVLITSTIILVLILFLYWQVLFEKKRLKCKVCNATASKYRIHDYSTSLHLKGNKMLKEGVSGFSIYRPVFQKLGREFFLFSDLKVNKMSVFTGSSSSYRGTYLSNPFFHEFYPTKFDWNNSFSNESHLFCGECFFQKFKNDERVLYDVLQERMWFE
jgi:hypothetical protein